VLYTVADGLRSLAVLLSPVMPEATAKLWSALGAPAGLGELEDQVIVDAGHWAQLPPGSHLGHLDPLFPRIETDTP
jgi:methionyl-tRNA synthetase